MFKRFLNKLFGRKHSLEKLEDNNSAALIALDCDWRARKYLRDKTGLSDQALRRIAADLPIPLESFNEIVVLAHLAEQTTRSLH